ncbi:MAG TPA: glucose-1-phosphate adenylyltransferase [Methylomirabilota bacterium]|nr:glucose-1-phosphate adenylyltransferase [Methylomirabilota bacterium]
MRPDRVLAMILAGGRGERLYPLTRERSKPAVPFGGRYRIIDFVLSNFVNSGILAIYVLVQYKAQSLIEHLRVGWRASGLVADHFIIPVPPQMRVGDTWYRGSADAVLQNLNLIEDFAPDLVAVFGADHIYRMDVNQMVAFHREREADVTVAARPVPLDEAGAFGVLEVDASGRILDFAEKPARPRPLPDDPTHAYVSMGNYLFSRRTLTESLLADARRDSAHDFGRSIIPELVPRARVFAYDFQANVIPGIRPYEERGYWRDVGTLDVYYRAHMDLLGEEPRFDLDNHRWLILTGGYSGPPGHILSGTIENVALGAGCRIRRAHVRNSILGRAVAVEEGAMIEDSVVMDFTVVGKGAHLRRTIVDRFNVVTPGQDVGLDLEADRRRYHVDPAGIVVIPRGGRREFLWSTEEP